MTLVTRSSSSSSLAWTQTQVSTDAIVYIGNILSEIPHFLDFWSMQYDPIMENSGDHSEAEYHPWVVHTHPNIPLEEGNNEGVTS